MKLTGNNHGYTMRLTANETHAWANRPGQRWPCSQLAGIALMVQVDDNGLCDILAGGRDGSDIGGDEIDACVGDHLKTEYRHLWPTWEEKPSTCDTAGKGCRPCAADDRWTAWTWTTRPHHR